jgi:hypothetical protein
MSDKFVNLSLTFFTKINMRKKIASALIVIATLYGHLHAQTVNTDSLIAATYFANEDYNTALKEYLKIYKTHKEDTAVNYKIGLCYLNINDDKSKAIPYLEYVYNKGGYRDELLMHLGMANMYAYKFDDALTLFNFYRKIIHSKKFELIDNYYEDVMEGKIDYQKKITVNNFGKIDHLIENCESAIEFVKNPMNVTFENLGPDINSKYPDYNPFVTQDEGTLYFTSRREENSMKLKSWQGYPTADIYYSRVEDGQWSKAQNVGTNINTAEDEECVYVTPNGSKMIICEENETVADDLFYVPLEVPKPHPIIFSEPINTAFREFQGCITEDGNTMFVASDRDGGLGETDIYILKKLPTGDWSAPRNLGPGINTKYKEAFPVFDEKSNVLYFASEGHVNIGGYDIFTSDYDPEEQTFGPAINMGYPINTPEDNMEYTYAGNGRSGYISAHRNGGLGDLDIYKVTFNEIEKRPSVIRGFVSLKSSDSTTTTTDAMVSLKDATTNKVLDSKMVNPNSGRYIFAVETGKYILTIKSAGYIDIVKEANVYDKADYVFEIENNFMLRQIGDTTTDVPPALPIKVAAPVISGTSDKKTNDAVMLKGLVATNDLDTLQKDIAISVAIVDSKTKEVIERKDVNLKNSEYLFYLKPGAYELKVESEGYDEYVETIAISENPHILNFDKNVILKKSSATTATRKEYSRPIKTAEPEPAAEVKKEKVTEPKKSEKALQQEETKPVEKTNSSEKIVVEEKTPVTSKKETKGKSAPNQKNVAKEKVKGKATLTKEKSSKKTTKPPSVKKKVAASAKKKAPSKGKK